MATEMGCVYADEDGAMGAGDLLGGEGLELWPYVGLWIWLQGFYFAAMREGIVCEVLTGLFTPVRSGRGGEETRGTEYILGVYKGNLSHDLNF